jgi:NADPH:quinone reductase-like Zn-dependent oxidoreductase
MGRSGLRRPNAPNVGADVAGRVEAVGKGVEELRPGDEVFGSTGYSWAEYAPARPAKLARKPANVSFEEAGTVAVAGLTALQAVRDHAHVQPGQKVLINGASGGVGTYAVQIAKLFGAEVTAVCSTANVDLVRSLGADRVCDYTKEDFTRMTERHDAMLDVAGSRSFLEFRRVLTPEATVVAVGAPMAAKAIGPLKHLVGTRLKAFGRSQKIVNFVAKINEDDLQFMGEQLAAGTVKAVIDRTYDLSQAKEALAYLGTTHARAKVVITL